MHASIDVIVAIITQMTNKAKAKNFPIFLQSIFVHCWTRMPN